MLLRKQRVESGGGGMGVPKKRGLYEMSAVKEARARIGSRKRSTQNLR